jgi:chromosomal replication initiation ATPase DnaA
MMTDKPRQLPLALPVEEQFEEEDFLISPCNEEAYLTIDQWPDWPDGVLILQGPEASGKSHLAKIWAARSRAWSLSAEALTPDRVPRLVSNGTLVIEDCDHAALNGALDEHALFHLLNAVREQRGFVLLTARQAPDLWGIQTRDLLSRLRLAPKVTLQSPDDALLGAVLVKLFLDRQLMIDTSVIEVLKARTERSLAAARVIVDELDREALARGRRITRAFVLEFLREQRSDEV